jgi:dTDP-4-amino-4,6-dideoxygalactose transaminase
VDSGTSALELILRAYHIGPGDEVIVPANTFIATALAVTQAGADVVLVDVIVSVYDNHESTGVTERTSDHSVHLYGQPVDRRYFGYRAQHN